MVSMRPVDSKSLEFGGRKLETDSVDTHTSKLDLSLEIYRENGVYYLGFEYAAELFGKRTVEMYLSLIHIFIQRNNSALELAGRLKWIQS